MKLQLCSWHAAEAIKKRIVNEEYSSKMRSELVSKIWNWIKAPTISLLIKRRIDLMNHLRPKEVTYLTEYYGPKEHQFVYAFSRLLPNLGARLTLEQKVVTLLSKTSQIDTLPFKTAYEK